MTKCHQPLDFLPHLCHTNSMEIKQTTSTMNQFIQHTTNPTQVEIGVEYYLPTDDLFWIPNGFAHVNVIVDADDLDSDYYETLQDAAEGWCYEQPGVEFSQLLMEP